MTESTTKYRWALVIEDEPVINRICERTLETDLNFYRYVEHVQPVLSGRFIFTTGDILSNNYAG